MRLIADQGPDAVKHVSVVVLVLVGALLALLPEPYRQGRSRRAGWNAIPTRLAALSVVLMLVLLARL